MKVRIKATMNTQMQRSMAGRVMGRIHSPPQRLRQAKWRDIFPRQVSRQTKTRCCVAMPLVTMKTSTRSLIMSLCGGMWLWLGHQPAAAREPVRGLQDLLQLEAKVAAVSRNVLPATVALLSDRTGASGSGVIVAEDGLVLTAAHVIQGRGVGAGGFPDGKQVQGKVLGANYSKDIAMVKIVEARASGPCRPGGSKPLDAGDWVVALGHSAGFDAGAHPAGALRPRDFERAREISSPPIARSSVVIPAGRFSISMAAHRHPFVDRQIPHQQQPRRHRRIPR
jgi:hypothetical protein